VTSKIIFNSDMIKIMSIFTNITSVNAKDCIESNNKMIFIVDENMAGKAIGKQGINIKKLEAKIKKKVKIVEYNKDVIRFIQNLIYPYKAKDIVMEDNIYTITPIDNYTRGLLIGRNAINLNENENIIKRYFNIKKIKVV
jgi:transcription termination/antitermination protein NusA